MTGDKFRARADGYIKAARAVRSRGTDRRQPTMPSAASHPRRHFLRIAAGAAGLAAVSREAWAQAYPTRILDRQSIADEVRRYGAAGGRP